MGPLVVFCLSHLFFVVPFFCLFSSHLFECLLPFSVFHFSSTYLEFLSYIYLEICLVFAFHFCFILGFFWFLPFDLSGFKRLLNILYIHIYPTTVYLQIIYYFMYNTDLTTVCFYFEPIPSLMLLWSDMLFLHML